MKFKFVRSNTYYSIRNKKGSERARYPASLWKEDAMQKALESVVKFRRQYARTLNDESEKPFYVVKVEETVMEIA